MVVDPPSAAHFIAGYTRLLSEVHRQSGGKPYKQLLEMLAAAREAVNANPALISAAATSLEASGQAIPSDVLHAVETLRFKQWVFLRDTTTHSVFIEPDANEAYAVLGLTDRIRNIVGGSAVAIQAGVVEYRGRFVCDGLVGNPIWLGSNLKKEFNAALSHLKKKGRFHVACEP
jgi:hypothetical protein